MQPPSSLRPESNPAAPPAGTELCRLEDIADPGARGFSWRSGEALFNGFVVRQGDEVFGYVDYCPHAGWPLAMREDDYLSRNGAAILCHVHAAMFAIDDGHSLTGLDHGLIPWPVAAGEDGVVRAAQP